jgi:hypothetical protein
LGVLMNGPEHFSIHRLPNTGELLFGREREMDQLD